MSPYLHGIASKSKRWHMNIAEIVSEIAAACLYTKVLTMSTPVSLEKPDEFKKDLENDSSSASDYSVSKQLEIEAGNEIR